MSGNNVGGIESSNGSVFTISGTLTNSTESYAKPTAWEDGITELTVVGGTFTESLTVVPGQIQYYLDAGNVVDPAVTLANAKTSAVTELNEYKTLTDFSADNQTVIGTKIATGTTAINNATTIENVATALATAKSDLDTVKTLVQEAADALATAKTIAHDALDIALASYSQANYTAENWAILNLFKTDGDTAIDAAGTTDTVTSAQNTTTDGMDAVEILTPVQQYATTKTTTLDDDTTEVVLDNGSGSVEEIIVPASIPSTQQITLDMSKLLDDSSDSVTLGSNDMTLERQGTNNYSALLPAGTEITGDSSWDGTLMLPMVTTLTSEEGTVNVAVEMGSTQRLDFSQAVKVTLGGMAGKNALYSDGTGEHTISACIDASDASAGSLAIGGECSISVGGNLVIWTYHFTTFAAYTPTPSNSNSGGGSSYRIQPVVIPVITTPSLCPNGMDIASNCTTAPIIGKVLGAEKFNFTKFVKNNSRGDEVMELQKLLNTLGHNSGVADGKFGPKTKGAVIRFQLANGLKGDGIVGPLTRAVLNK